MKTRILLLLVLLMSGIFSYAQNASGLKCGTMEYLQKQKDADPNLESKMLLQEKQIQQWIKQYAESNKLNKAGTTITIPVVVHIIWKTTDENISDQRVTEQIAMSNRDFAGENTNSMGAFANSSPSLRANTDIQFCLAKKTPDGQATSGIERRETTVDYFTNNSVKYYSYGGMDAWDPTRYMNIWVCNTSGFSGYAQFPGTGSIETFGVIVTYKYFGDVTDAQRSNGGLTTHEFGHCFNLRHIWADDQNASEGTCSGTDYCDDTPNQAIAVTGSPTGTITDACSPNSPGIMYMNFMDYTYDDVGTNLTPDQSTRMHASFGSVGHLISLASSDACSEPSTCEIPNGLNATSVNGKSTLLQWRAMYNATSYNIKYRKEGASTWTSTSSSTNSKSIKGLSNNTSYEFQVQNDCSGNGTSNFSPTYVLAHSSGSGGGGSGGGKGGKGGNKNEMTDLIISADESGNIDQFILYPNPAKEQVTIKFQFQNSENAEIKLIDLTGRIIKSEKIVTLTGVNKYTLNLNSIGKGFYFVELTTSGQRRVSKKIIID